MAKDTKVSRRYAHAIYDFLGDDKKISATSSELIGFGRQAEGNRELGLALYSSLCTDAERVGLVDALSKSMKLSDPTAKILTMLAKNRRLNYSSEIGDELKLMLLQSAKVVPLKVETSVALKDEEKKKIEERFEKILGSQVEASYEDAPQLIGGLKVTAGGRTFDGTLKTQLSVVSDKLMEG